MNDYANHRYAEIQASIFSNDGTNFFTILRNIRQQVRQTSENVSEKYKPVNQFHSDWDSRIILVLLAIIVFYGLIAAAISYFVIGFIVTRLMKKNKADFILHWLFGSGRVARRQRKTSRPSAFASSSRLP